MKRIWPGLLAVILTALLSGCGSGGSSTPTFDNTGGAPPSGDSITFLPVTFPLDAFCARQLGSASISLLTRTETDIPDINGDAACSAALRTALASAYAGLTSDEALGIFTLNLGGCIRSYEVALVNRDDLVIRPWILLHNTSLGAINPVCTADVILDVYVLRFDSAAGANAMELTIGVINPNFPRSSSVPVF